MCRAWRSTGPAAVVRAGGGGGGRREGVPGPQGGGGVGVGVGGDAGGGGVGVNPADVGIELVSRHHPLGVAGEQVPGGGGQVVGDQQGGLVPADVFHRDLADLGADVGELDHVLVQAGAPVAAGPGAGDGRPLPRGAGGRGGRRRVFAVRVRGAIYVA